MSFNAGAVVGEVRLKTQDWKQGVQQVKGDLKQMGEATRSLKEELSSMAKSLLAVGGTVTAFYAVAIKGASDAQETLNLFRESFGDLADEADRWAQDLAQALGMNIRQIRDFSGVMQVMTQGMGLGAEAAFEISRGLTKLAFDIASFRNLNPDEAFLKLRSAMVGETEAIKSLGVVMTEENLKLFAWKEGIAEAGKELTNLQKVVARYGFILQSTQKDQGDMARTADQFANQMRRLGSNVQALRTAIGQPLLQPLERFLGVVNQLLTGVQQWIRDNQALVASLVRYSAALGAAATATGTLTLASFGLAKALAAVRAGALAMWAALALPASTATAAVLGIGAATYTLRAEWNQNLHGMQTTFGEFVEWVGKGWDWLREKVGGFARFMFDALRDSINNTIGLFDAFATTVGRLFDSPTDFFGALAAGRDRYSQHLDYLGNATANFVAGAKDSWELLGDIAGAVGDQIGQDWNALIKRMMGDFDPDALFEGYEDFDWERLLEGAVDDMEALSGKTGAAAQEMEQLKAAFQEFADQRAALEGFGDAFAPFQRGGATLAGLPTAGNLSQDINRTVEEALLYLRNFQDRAGLTFEETQLLAQDFWNSFGRLSLDAIQEVIDNVRDPGIREALQDALDAEKAVQPTRWDEAADGIRMLGQAVSGLGPKFAAAARAADIAYKVIRAAKALAGDPLAALSLAVEAVGDAFGLLGDKSEEELKGVAKVIDEIKEASAQWIDRITEDLLEFVKTGKLAVGDLAQYIADELFKIGVSNLVVEPLVQGVGGLLGFAKGGGFDQGHVVSSPEWFKHADGLGLRGEAGTEVILPAMRMPDGTLGVRGLGGGGGLTVVVNDYRAQGADVKVRRSGQNLEITIEDAVEGALSGLARDGRLDSLLAGYYGLRRAAT